ncbi:MULTISPECIES: AMP-binding protein, partial [Streptomyces]|uniref:AMP-binding protein n=1 Tax=Streptomyces TaxID=1883 RepID=UPI0034DEBFDE
HWAREAPAAEAAVDLGSSRPLTWAEFAREVDACRAALCAAGVRQGDAVAVLSASSIFAWVSFLATAAQGAIWVGLNPRYTAGELRHILHDARPRLVFAPGDGATGTVASRLD